MVYNLLKNGAFGGLKIGFLAVGVSELENSV